MAVAARVGKYLQPHFSFGVVDVEAVLVVGADAGALSFAAAGITTVRLVCSHAGVLDGPLNELDEPALYRLLGDAWIAQLQVNPGEQYYLGPFVEMGKREFATVAPCLRHNLAGAQPHGAHACVAAALKQSASWSMPVAVVTALALRTAIFRPKPNFILVDAETSQK